MGQPYVGEIRMFAGTFEPLGWMICDGRPLPISENEVLFQLIGTTYGGDGESTFNLPNLQSRVPIHFGTFDVNTSYQMGVGAGTEQETLTVNQIPVHTHAMVAANTTGTAQTPGGAVYAKPDSNQPNLLTYGSDSPVKMNAAAIAPTGGSQPHENCQPFLCINFIISLFGIFPSQT